MNCREEVFPETQLPLLGVSRPWRQRACLSSRASEKGRIITLSRARRWLLTDAEGMGRGSKMLGDRYQASTRGLVVEEYRNEYLDGLVGQVALVKQLTAPQVDEELLDKFEEDPLTGKVETLRSRTALRMVVGYDELGVVLRPVTEDPEGVSVFVPWSAVIEVSPAVVSEE